MANKSRRARENAEKVDRTKVYSMNEAFDTLKGCRKAKFDETVEVVVRLGVDPKKSDQMVRGAVSLPHGLGKQVRVIAFAEGEIAEACKEAGAIEVGSDELATKIEGGWTVTTGKTLSDVRVTCPMCSEIERMEEAHD